MTHITQKCVNNVIYSKSCVTFILLKILNLVLSKIIGKDEKKDENDSLSTRLKNRKENKSIPAHPMYSVGEDFYSMYHEDKDLRQEKIKTKI